MPLPSGSHSVRLCQFSLLGDDGEITSTCFTPHEGRDERPADRYLSVHWLEYLGCGPIPDCLAALRTFLLTSPHPGERKPTCKGKLAVLDCDRTRAKAFAQVQTELEFKHVPRVETAATSIEVSPEGEVTMGVARAQQAMDAGLALDPHSGIFTMPDAAAHELAVQLFLSSQVVHAEPGLL